MLQTGEHAWRLRAVDSVRRFMSVERTTRTSEERITKMLCFASSGDNCTWQVQKDLLSRIVVEGVTPLSTSTPNVEFGLNIDTIRITVRLRRDAVETYYANP